MAKNKKEPVYKKTTAEDSWFTRKWNTPKGRAALQLGIYGIVCAVLLIIIGITSSSRPTSYNVNYQTNKKTYEECLKDLKNNEFDYEYKISGNDTNVIFRGQKTDGIDTGYREDASGVIKYSIEPDGIYQVLMDKKQPLENLYANVNKDYLDVTYLLSLIENKDYEENDKKYTYRTDEITINVILGKDYIENINFIKDDLFYDLKFSNVSDEVKENISQTEKELEE